MADQAQRREEQENYRREVQLFRETMVSKMETAIMYDIFPEASVGSLFGVVQGYQTAGGLDLSQIMLGVWQLLWQTDLAEKDPTSLLILSMDKPDGMVMRIFGSISFNVSKMKAYKEASKIGSGSSSSENGRGEQWHPRTSSIWNAW